MILASYLQSGECPLSNVRPRHNCLKFLNRTKKQFISD
jgi:hypothetical protein